MNTSEHLDEYAGLPVAVFNGEKAPDGRPVGELPQVAETAWHVGSPEGEAFTDLFARFLREVDTTEVTALIIGYWGDHYDETYSDPVGALIEAAESFPKLKSLFLGDTGEEAPIIWIENAAVSPLFLAFPGLERLDVRGSLGVSFDPITSERLKVLRFESVGLPADVVRAVAASELPNLEHLDLWLGGDEYGGDATVADLAPILGGEWLPALRHLSLGTSEIQDEIAAAIAGAPIVARLESLGLAMGTLTDQGAEALLSGQPLTHLRRLDLHHHFLSDPMMEKVRAALPGVDIDLSEQEDPDDGVWTYFATPE